MVLVVDLQDVGTRVYTYISTMANCLRACRAHSVPVIVCDRPNPIGGEAVEGPVLDSAFASFVGQFPIPMRHGMTIGELAQLFNEHFSIGAALEVAKMDGWQRSMCLDMTGLPWVLPSPNLPTLASAIVYPGTVLLEGTNISEGRGTTKPFEIVGAPWIDAERFANQMNDARLLGVHFRAASFVPTFQKHAGQRCGGCSDPRHRPSRVSAGAGGCDAAGRASPRRPRTLRPGAIRRMSTNGSSDPSTSSRARTSSAATLKTASRPPRSRAAGSRRWTSFGTCGNDTCSTSSSCSVLGVDPRSGWFWRLFVLGNLTVLQGLDDLRVPFVSDFL